MVKKSDLQVPQKEGMAYSVTRELRLPRDGGMGPESRLEFRSLQCRERRSPTTRRESKEFRYIGIPHMFDNNPSPIHSLTHSLTQSLNHSLTHLINH